MNIQNFIEYIGLVGGWAFVIYVIVKAISFVLVKEPKSKEVSFLNTPQNGGHEIDIQFTSYDKTVETKDKVVKQ